LKRRRLTKHQRLLAKALKRFQVGKPIRVKMLYTTEINAFIRRVEAAHRATAKSKLVF
jgi:hypothetical protein